MQNQLGVKQCYRLLIENMGVYKKSMKWPCGPHRILKNALGKKINFAINERYINELTRTTTTPNINNIFKLCF